MVYNNYVATYDEHLAVDNKRKTHQKHFRSSLPDVFCKKEALAQVFSYEFCEISKNTFFYRTPLVAASGICISQPLKYTNPKINLTKVSCGKHINIKISQIHGEEVLLSQFQT